ncbi:MAG: DUF423 domain-containing protein [Verrucomicrobiae bacterium]|nr:DUF423 domain-containing protein [Verrucomicrobiae bacterium]
MSSLGARRISAVFGFLAVALGAFGAHGLKAVLAEHGTTAIWQTAVLYHLVHAVVAWAVAAREPLRRLPWWSFVAGITIFSGTLYVLAVTGIRWLGAITPLGGVALLVGWAALAAEKRAAQ